MAAHWTYDTPDPSALFQGDVIGRSEDLRGLLSEIHPYFAKESKYQHFMLLTQSCDLVLRSGNKCKAPYLTIAAVRNLSDLLISKELGNATRGKAIGRVVSQSSAQKVRDFLQRLVNNNDPNYFFLRADMSQGLGDDFCACLRVTVPLRAEHYGLLLKAKTGQLKGVFQAKLGWLVGNNYSRVGTPDWADAKGDLKALIDGLLSDISVVEDKKLARILKVIKNAGDDPTEDRVLSLQEDPRTTVPSRSKLFRQAFAAIWAEDAEFMDKEHLKAALQDPAALDAALKRGLEESEEDGLNGVENDEIASRISNSKAFQDALGELVDRLWPDSTPPAKRTRFLGRLENEADFTDALKEP